MAHVSDDIFQDEEIVQHIEANEMTTAQLKKELAQRNLKTTGDKAELSKLYKSAILAENARMDSDDDDKLEPEAMTIKQLRDELNKRRYKTTGNKADLVKLLKAALVIEETTSEKSSNASEDDDEEDSVHDRRSTRRQSKFVSTFNDVKELIDGFGGERGEDVTAWIEEFEEVADQESGAICKKQYTQGGCYMDVRACT